MAYIEAEKLMKELKEKKNWYVNRGLEDYWKIKKQQNENSKLLVKNRGYNSQFQKQKALK